MLQFMGLQSWIQLSDWTTAPHMGKGQGVCAHARSLQSCLTLCNPLDHSLPGFSVHGVLQTRILEWVAFSSPGDLPNSRIKSTSLRSSALGVRFFTTSTTWEIQSFGMHGELILGHSTPHGYQTLLIQWHSIVIDPPHLHFCICRFNQWESVNMKGRLYWH